MHHHSFKALPWLLQALLLALLGQLYLLPFSDSSYVFSLGVLLLEVFLPLTWGRRPMFLFISTTGLLTALLRLLALSFTADHYYLKNFCSVLLFYLVFGAISVFFIARLHLTGSNMFPVLMAADVLGNLAELRFFGYFTFHSVQVMVLLALIRTLFAAILYYLYQRHQLLIIREYHEKRYLNLNQTAANLYADIFYLNKSRGDLEQLTKNCYALYDQLKEQPAYAGQALRLATGIHEIKKDYTRILSGLNGVLNTTRTERSTMLLTEIFRLVQRGTEDTLLSPEYQRHKNTILRFSCPVSREISDYYDLFIILNNLVINAIQADASTVTVTAEETPDTLILHVSDNGSGINESDLPYIFAPGFSTKMTEDGSLSAGIGLCHVKDIVAKRAGELTVHSTHSGTTFTITLPAPPTADQTTETRSTSEKTSPY